MSLFCLYKNVGFCRGSKPRVSKAFVAFWDDVYKLKHKGDKVMKKYLLLGTSLIVASSAYAEFDCTKQPTCADLGYLQTATDCAGKNMLKCPFDTDKVFCESESSGDDTGANKPQTTGQGCDTVGDILYSDLNCYEPLDKIASGVEPIAVVFDTENRSAIGLNNAPTTMVWSSVEEDISGLTNYSSSTTALTETTTGKQNTATIVALGGDYASSNYAPGYCYNLTEGEQPIGSWFLPSLKELKAIYDNKATINTALTNTGGSTLTEDVYWSSTEFLSDSVWIIYMYLGSGNDGFKINNDFLVRCAIAY